MDCKPIGEIFKVIKKIRPSKGQRVLPMGSLRFSKNG